MYKFIPPAIIAFISIYFQSWIGSFLVVVFLIGIERRTKNIVTGIEEKWNPTDELTKCINHKDVKKQSLKLVFSKKAGQDHINFFLWSNFLKQKKSLAPFL